MKFRSAFPMLLLATTAILHAQAEPEKKNIVYGHPAQISTMVGVAASPLALGLVWLQVDYERWLKPGLSAIGGIQYLDLYPTLAEDGEGSAGFGDILAGIRWYPGHKFSGFYLQPQLNYNRLFLSTDDDDESWKLGMNRFGMAGYLGFNGKWEVISVDWNIGFSYLTTGDTKITKKDKRTGETETTDISEEDEEFADYILTPLTPSTTFSVGYMF